MGNTSEELNMVKLTAIRNETRIADLEAASKRANDKQHEHDLTIQHVQYSVDAVVDTIAAIRRDMVAANERVTKHMDTEEAHNIEQNKVIAEMAADIKVISNDLKSTASKEDLAKTDGKVSTMWIIGGFTVLAVFSAIFFVTNYISNQYIEENKKLLENMKTHTTRASKINHNGIVKKVEEKLNEIKK